MNWSIGEYGPEMAFLAVDDTHNASRPFDIKHRTIFVKQCYRCSALVQSSVTHQHDEYHKANDIQVEQT